VQPVTLVGRDRGGHGPGQHAVNDQVQQRPVETEGDPAAGVLEPDRDRGSSQGDHTDGVGGAVDLDRQPRGQRTGGPGAPVAAQPDGFLAPLAAGPGQRCSAGTARS
jgi:hypothetical protein